MFKWVSPSLLGACSGTPVLSRDDLYVFVTHNGVSTGTFTVLNAADGSILFNATDESQLLSPPGIFFSPFPGPYPEAAGNTNDLVIFGNRPLPTADTVPDENSVYAFQFPIGYPNSLTELGLVTLLNETSFQATTAPLITNGGSSMFWGVSRSRVEGWIGKAFNRDPGGGGFGYPRGSPPSLAVLADLAIGADTITPTIYSGNAGVGFGAISTASGEMVLSWNVTTTSSVYTQAKVAPADADEVVFFIEDLGFAYAVDVLTGDILWRNATGGGVRGSFALNAASDTMYFATISGIVSAWQVAEFGASTSFAPVASPAVNSSLAPTPTNATGSTAPVATPTVGGNSTYDVILSNPNVTILPDLLTILNLTAALSSPTSNFTIFVPYDSAFTTAFNQSYLDLLKTSEWVHHLSCLVSGHAIPDFANTADTWIEGEEVMDLSNATVTLGTSPPSVNAIVIDSLDNVATNGVVQFIAEPILPSCVADSITDILARDGDFSTLVALVEGAGLVVALTNELALTLLAPTNEAFEKVAPNVIEFLGDPVNYLVLQKLLFGHIFRNMIYLDPTDDPGAYTTSNGASVDFSSDKGSFSANDAAIAKANILAKNGIIHWINEVLISPDLELPTPMPVTMAPTAPSTSTKTNAPTAKPNTIAPTTRKPTLTPKPTPASSGSITGLSALITAALVVGIWM